MRCRYRFVYVISIILSSTTFFAIWWAAYRDNSDLKEKEKLIAGVIPSYQVRHPADDTSQASRSPPLPPPLRRM